MATNSAVPGLASWQPRVTTSSSVGPPLRASAAFLKAGLTSPIQPRSVAPVPVQAAPGSSSLALVRARRLGLRPRLHGLFVLLFAPVGHVDDDRMRPADQRRPEPVGRLVVQDAFPPAARDVLGNHDEGDRV